MLWALTANFDGRRHTHGHMESLKTILQILDSRTAVCTCIFFKFWIIQNSKYTLVTVPGVLDDCQISQDRIKYKTFPTPPVCLNLTHILLPTLHCWTQALSDKVDAAWMPRSGRLGVYGFFEPMEIWQIKPKQTGKPASLGTRKKNTFKVHGNCQRTIWYKKQHGIIPLKHGCFKTSRRGNDHTGPNEREKWGYVNSEEVRLWLGTAPPNCNSPRIGG